MKHYAVSIQYGHFVQIWNVEANSKEDAWKRAESHGNLQYQTIYKEIYPMRNYVTCLDDNAESNTISKELYDEWLKEAKELGMMVDGYCGLPFNDVI
jgi:hypothetical protein